MVIPATHVPDPVTVTAWLLVGLFLITATLVVLAAVDLRETDRKLPRRPLPLPRRRPDLKQFEPDPTFTAPLLTHRIELTRRR